MTTNPPQAATAAAAASEQFANLALASVVPSSTNPRKTFDQVKLQDLADSIKASGVHQPCLLYTSPSPRDA